MTSPANTTSTPDGRVYTWRGESFFSVTTILGAMPKPALVPWAARTVAEGAVEAVKAGTLQAMITQSDQAAVQFLKALPYSSRDKSADAGKVIHKVIEARILGVEHPPVPIQLRPQLDTFERFTAEYQPVWEASELTVYNRAEAYAGTFDAIAVIGGRRLMVDVKTGKGVYPEHALQLAAYRRGEFIGAPDGTEVPMPEVDGACVLHLRPRSYRLIEVETTDDVYRTFLHCREIFRWQRTISRTAIGGAVMRPGDTTASRAADAVRLFGDSGVAA